MMERMTGMVSISLFKLLTSKTLFFSRINTILSAYFAGSIVEAGRSWFQNWSEGKGVCGYVRKEVIFASIWGL